MTRWTVVPQNKEEKTGREAEADGDKSLEHLSRYSDAH